MPSKETPTRARYAISVLDALRSLGGTARPAEVYAWLEANNRIADADRAELATGGTRWDKETRFGVLVLERAGLVDRQEHGVWRLTEAGGRVDLTPRIAELLVDATNTQRGPISLERTYAAIRNAAKAGTFISYGDLAAANGVEWNKARPHVPRALGRLVTLAYARGWPMLSAIVVNKEDIATGTLEGTALEGFLAAARMVGIEPENAPAFVREQQNLVFQWGKTAPERLGAEGKGELKGDAGQSRPYVSDMSAGADGRGSPQYWIAGAQWGGSNDQMPRFLDEGIWQVGDDELANLVSQMKDGDRIGIKSAFVQKHDLPFDAAGQTVSVMRIKATGTVTGNWGDGRTVDVRWDPPFEPREWYFYTFRTTLARLDPNDDRARRLIAFIFGGSEQDYDWWLKLPYFADKYGKAPEPVINLPGESPDSELDADEEDASPAYSIETIVAEGSFIPQDVLAEVLATLQSKRNLVLQGPPGTGKSWLAKRLGYALIGSKGQVGRDRLRVVQFHPSMSYEDFVRGWRPGSDGKLELRDGIFLSAIEAALANPDPYVLVIEEINRGNPAQIFGELLTLIEDTKRGKEDALEIAYPRQQGERIYVPENLFIIGTMNLADRSLALVDLALRRRFAFVTLEPTLGSAWRNWSSITAGFSDEVLDLIQSRLENLNQQIAADRTLGMHFRIGHSYVTPTGPLSDEMGWFRRKVESEIVPLLSEYWFDQENKVNDARTALLAGL